MSASGRSSRTILRVNTALKGDATDAAREHDVGISQQTTGLVPDEKASPLCRDDQKHGAFAFELQFRQRRHFLL
jgi:hypothetical protein